MVTRLARFLVERDSEDTRDHHVPILKSLPGPKRGAIGNGWPLRRPFLRTVNRNRLISLPTTHGLCDNRRPTRLTCIGR